jgi:hypothetical protein
LSSGSSLLRGEVAGILEDGLVLNIGNEQGVKKGMRFVVYEEAHHIYDSHSNDLGALEIPKAEVEIVDVQEKLSIAKNTDVRNLTFDTISSMTQGMQVRRELPVDEHQITKISIDRRIKNGDKVRQVP